MSKVADRAVALKLVPPYGECNNLQSPTDASAMNSPQRIQFVMYADVSDSARLFERLGDTEATYAVERCLKRMDRAIAGYGGKVAEITKEGLLAVFETAEQACQGAIDMQSRVSKLPPVSGLKVAIRIGLHGGPVGSEKSALSGSTIDAAGKIASKARIDQILASSAVLSVLPRHTVVLSRPLPDLGQIEAENAHFELGEIDWSGHNEHQRRYSISVDATPSQFIADLERLCVRYHGNAFLLDEKAPFLTLGRDPSCKLIIADRKASRLHGRIERRNNTYYYVDSSTNGSFVTCGNEPEIMVRRGEVMLKGNGRVAFGASASDPNADYADFEHL